MTANRSRYDGASLSAPAKRAEDGRSFLISSKLSAANAGGVVRWLVKSGNKTIIVSNRVITTNGNELTYRAYALPVVTSNGTPINPSPLNLAQSLVSTVMFYSSPVLSSPGIPLSPSYLPGATGQGNSSTGNLYANEQENIIPPNTTLMLEVKNDGNENPASIELYVVWSEVNDPAPFQE
tara:strand:- start:1779 stop:2318 length:540 start_codon:yes stop_codon:yes gene_type:complete